MFSKIALALMFVSVSSFAQSNERLVEEISELSRKIRQEATNKDITKEKLVEAKTLLEDALDALQSKGNGSTDCFNFAYEKYYSGNSSAVATDKAIKACKTITDVEVAKFAFEKFYSGNSSSVAMDKSTELSSRPMYGKVDMVKFAYEKYFSGNSSSVAIDKSGVGIAKVPRGSLECLKTLFVKYYSGNSSSVAMDKTIEACAQ